MLLIQLHKEDVLYISIESPISGIDHELSIVMTNRTLVQKVKYVHDQKMDPSKLKVYLKTGTGGNLIQMD